MPNLADESDSPLSSPPSSIFEPGEDREYEMRPRDKGIKTTAGCHPLHAEPKTMREQSITIEALEDELPAKSQKHDSPTMTPTPTPADEAANRKRKAPTGTAKRVVISKKPKNEARKWQSPFVYTDPKSPLASSDLRAILLNSRAWDILSPEKQKQVLALLPDHTHIVAPGTKHPRPNVEALRNSDTFRFDSARYCESIEAGKHDPDWLYSAWAAHAKRSRGDFDEYQVKKFEKEWSVKIGPEYHPKVLRNQGYAASASVTGDGPLPATPDRTHPRPAEEMVDADNQDLPSEVPETASPCRSSSSVEKKIAKFNIAREDMDREPDEPLGSLGGTGTDKDAEEDMGEELSHKT